MQQHRGPDHSVLASVGSFTLGNTRLAIQDPSPAGNQPFVSADGRYHCVFNGEIYNHRRLVERYQLPVRTACDGEVIPAAVGEAWAGVAGRIAGHVRYSTGGLLSRSVSTSPVIPFGIKPLYWRVLPDGSGLRFRGPSAYQPGHTARTSTSEAIARYLHLGAMAADQAPFQEITLFPLTAWPTSTGTAG